MTDTSSESGIQAVSPLQIPRSKPGIKWDDPKVINPVGVPLVLTAVGHLEVIADPSFPAADYLEFYLNGEAITVPFTVNPDTNRTTFKVPRTRLLTGVIAFHYVAKRFSGNDETSPTLFMVYSKVLPGGVDPIDDEKDIHEGLGLDLSEDVKQNGVDLVVAELGVVLTISYAFAKVHDVVTVFGNVNGVFKHTVVQENLGGAFDITLPKAFFIAGGNSPTFEISYTVEDQLGNTTQKALPSPSLSIKVDLTPKVELPPAPFVPALVGNVIIPIKYTTGFTVRVDWNNGFKPGDKAKLVVKGGTSGDGTPVFGYVAFNTNFRANFQFKPAFILANANKEVVFTWVLLRDGKETESEPLTLVIEPISVTDPNFPTAEIVEAYGTNVVDLRAFTGDARIVCAPWPFIGAGQKFWLHVLGTGIDGKAKTLPIAVDQTLTPEQIQNGLDYVLLRKELELFAAGKELRVRLSVDFYPNENVKTKVTFTVTRYTLVTAGMKATLEFLNAPYRIAPLGHLTDILLKLVDENGEFIKAAKVYLTIPNNFTYSDDTTGRKEFTTSMFGELRIWGIKGPDTPAMTYTFKAEYDGKEVSAKCDVTARGKIGELDFASTKNDMVFNPAGTKIYALDASIYGGFTVIDCATLNVMDTVPKVTGHAITISNDSNRAFIGSACGNTMSVINLLNQEVESYISDPVTMGEGVSNQEGQYGYFVGNGPIVLIDMVRLRHVSSFSVYGNAWNSYLRRSPNNVQLFVCMKANKCLLVFGLSTHQEIKRSATFAREPGGFAVSLSGDRLYVSFPDENRVRVFNSVTLLEEASIDVIKPRELTMTANGRLLFCGCDDGKIRAIDTASLKLDKIFDVPGTPKHLLLSPDDARLYVGYSDKTVMTVIQVE